MLSISLVLMQQYEPFYLKLESEKIALFKDSFCFLMKYGTITFLKDMTHRVELAIIFHINLHFPREHYINTYLQYNLITYPFIE